MFRYLDRLILDRLKRLRTNTDDHHKEIETLKDCIFQLEIAIKNLSTKTST